MQKIAEWANVALPTEPLREGTASVLVNEQHGPTLATPGIVIGPSRIICPGGPGAPTPDTTLIVSAIS